MNGNIKVFSTSPQFGEERKKSVKCEGTCECYYDNEDHHARRIGSLVYSSRYVSVVVVSILGFATARFVDDHIDDCYGQMKRVLGDSESVLISCSMEDVECDNDDGELILEEEGDPEIARILECNGHCVTKRHTNRRFNQPLAQEALKEMNCEQKWAGKRIIRIHHGDTKYFNKWASRGKVVYGANYNLQALKLYRSLYLSPFCRTFRSSYEWESSSGRCRTTEIAPCSASHNAIVEDIFHNIDCKIVRK